uniref:Phosphatidylinositol-glycan-specific phospholipase D-like n=1 Tax=Nothoprocta perdicaria TaxID=30464 RepID=A0A8C6ZZB8_NOTPE
MNKANRLSSLVFFFLQIDFRGSYSEAHSVGDFGNVSMLLQYISLGFRYVPVKDLAAIYQEFYGSEIITESTITDCTYLLFLELHGERLAVAKLFPTYAGKSPFLVEKFHDYFLGGVDDMAFWTNNIFEQTSHMLENGTSGCFLPENPLFIKCTSGHKNNYMSKRPRSEHYKNTTSSLTEAIKKNITFTERGVHFNMQAFLYKLLSPHGQSSKYISKPAASYFLTSPYARLGWAVISADLNQDGCEDVVVGAPGYSTLGRVQIGRVYVVYGSRSGLPPEDMDLDEKADQVLEGQQLSGRFGSALAVLDFNDDGVPDLAVGAPSVGSQFLTYKGAVYVYFGTEGRGLGSQPDVTITCQYSYCNFGWSLLAADVDGDGKADLVVGSPYAPGGGQQRGFVVAFYSFFNRSLLSVEDADWMVKGEKNYSWFGFSLDSCQLENTTLLLIGSPAWKHCVGWVMYSDCSLFLPSYSFFRFSFISTVLHQAGLAFMYELTESAQPSLLSIFSGDRRFSRFGGDVFLSDLDNDGLDEIIVTSPLRTNEITTILLGGEAGRVYIYNGNQTTALDVTGHCKSWISPCPEDWERSRFGSSVITVKSERKVRK